MPLSRLIYFSQTVALDSETAERHVENILDVARQKNEESGITGILLSDTHYYLQLLEGRRRPLNETYARILKSDLHTDVMLLDFRAIEKRAFDGFKMLYQPIDGTLSRVIGNMIDPKSAFDVMTAETLAALLSLYKNTDFQEGAVWDVGR